jgi:transposase-like protein
MEESNMLVPRQEYSRELKITAMREIDSGKVWRRWLACISSAPSGCQTWRSEWRAKGELAFPGKGAQPQPRLDADRISALERKVDQQTMEIDFFKKVLQRFRELPLPVAVNGDTDSTSKSKRQPKRGRS